MKTVKLAPAGERGEIYVRGEQVSGEYEGRGSVTDSAGWFPTRDAGSLDDEGYLFLEGRADDVIVRGGENLSPGEIEDVMLTHPAIADAAVVGVPVNNGVRRWPRRWSQSLGQRSKLRSCRTLSKSDCAVLGYRS